MRVIKDLFRDEVELTNSRWLYVINKHPEIEPYHNKMGLVLKEPDFVKKSKRDKNILLYYKFFPEIFRGKYLLVVVAKKIKNSIVTVYITDRIKKGAVVWQKG